MGQLIKFLSLTEIKRWRERKWSEAEEGATQTNWQQSVSSKAMPCHAMPWFNDQSDYADDDGWSHFALHLPLKSLLVISYNGCCFTRNENLIWEDKTFWKNEEKGGNRIWFWNEDEVWFSVGDWKLETVTVSPFSILKWSLSRSTVDLNWYQNQTENRKRAPGKL